MKQLFFAIVVFLVGCQDVKKPERPENLIGEEKMVAIFVDSYLSNAARSVDNKTIRDNGIKLDSFIYAKHDIDSLQFVTSNAFYTTDLNNYKELFLQVEKRLINLQEASTGEEDAQSKKQDSVAKKGVVTPPQN